MRVIVYEDPASRGQIEDALANYEDRFVIVKEGLRQDVFVEYMEDGYKFHFTKSMV